MKPFHTFPFALALMASLTAGSQTAASFWSRSDIFRDRCFIENKGQFDGKELPAGSDVLFGLKENNLQVYFSAKGLSYRYDVLDIPKELLEGMEEEGDLKSGTAGEREKELARQVKTIAHTVNVEWLGASSDAKIIGSQLAEGYYTYGDTKNFYKANGFRRLSYKGLYPGIDLEYEFHDVTGIKYSFIVHPGADPSLIRMKYSGAGTLSTDREGNLRILTPGGEIIDHAPVSFYESARSSNVSSSFILENNVLSFRLGAYDKNRTLVIDPWTVGVTMNSTNKALEVEKDNQGNIFILGGGAGGNSGGPLILRKYTAAGAIIWSYTITSGGTGMYGDDLKLDKAGNAYVSTGAFGGYQPIWKINAAGAPVWGSATQLMIEPYRLAFDCNATNLYATGGLADQNSICYLNMNTGALSSKVSGIFSSFIGNTLIGDDLRDWVAAPNGNFYGMTIGQGGPGRLFAFSPGFTPLWYINHGYPLTYWSAGYTGHLAAQPASLHLIAVNKNFIYTTSGAVVQKRNLATGAVIATVNIPGGILASNSNGNSGIVLDTCGNVYVSSQSGVYKYDPNLVFIASATTSGAVYDICLGNNGEILACGNGFLASLNLNACIPAPLQVNATATPSGNCLNGNTGTASATTSGGSPTYNYYWIPGGQTTSSVTGLAAGTYSVVVTDKDCNSDTAVVIVTSNGAPVTTVSQTNIKCNGGKNGTASVSVSGGTSPYTYSWSSGQNASSANGLSAGSYIVTVTDANGCKSVQTVNITQPSPFPVSVTVVNTTCNNPNGNATAIGSGSSGPYTYSWTTGSTVQYASGSFSNTLNSGTYTVTVTDANGCTATASALVGASTTNASATFTLSPNDTVCKGSTVNFTHTGSTSGVTYNNWTVLCINPFIWQNFATTNLSFTFTSAGTYTVSHAITVGGCTKVVSVTIVVINCTAPTVSAPGSVICPGSCATIPASVTGGLSPYTYSWNTGATTSTINPCPTVTTTYTVVVTDANGATGSAVATITINPAITANASGVNSNCSGNNGSASATVSGGTAPYTFAWSNGSTQASISNLSSGTYTVLITDNRGCTKTAAATVNSSSGGTASAISTNVSCFGGTNGTASATMTGGTGPYTFSWSTGGTQSAIANLQSGTYTVTVTDANGCSATATAIVTQPSAISVQTSTIGATCGQSNGSASVTANGGTGAFTYSWSNGGAQSAISNLQSGTYTITVTDANNCSATAAATVGNTSGGTATATATAVSCFGGNNGTATAIMTGGTGPYTFSWNTGAITSTIINQPSNTYTVTVTDANGCSATATASITQPSAITLQTSTIGATCGQSNGSASVTANGGTGAFTYSWSNGATTSSINLQPSNTYTVTVTDANNCSATAAATVGNTSGGTATATATAVSCFGGNNGTATATMTGGTGPYTFSWSNGGVQSAISNLQSGIFTVTVTDANGCSATATASVTQPSAINLQTSTIGATCGQSNGSASVTANGGTGAFTYSWSNGQTMQTASGLLAAGYTITVTDANNCTATAAVTISNTSGGTATATATAVSCFGGNNGTASATMTGGTGPYTFSWNTGGTQSAISNLQSGTYTVTVTDANGCSATATAIVTQPSAISVQTSTIGATCGQSNGSASVTANGGTGAFTYSWSNGGGQSSISNIQPGTYTITVTDANNCTATSAVTVGNTSGGTATATATAVSCFGGNNGTVTASMTGGTGPYTYSWSNGSTQLAVGSLTAGNYTVVITDANGCSATATASVTQPSAITLQTSTIGATCGQSNGSASVTANGGTGAFTYSWSNGGAQSAISNLQSGTYTVTVTDANGCTATAAATVTGGGLPTVNFTVTDSSGCGTVCVQFTALGSGTSFTWNFGDGNTSSSANPYHCYTKPGTYDVSLIISDNNGCSNNINKKALVNVFPQPVADFSANPQPTTILNPVIHFTDQSSGAINWMWTFSDTYNGSSTLQNPIYTYSDTGCFPVQLAIANQYGCKDTIVKPVCIRGEFAIWFPNAFTPDGDGLNDLFLPKGVGIDEAYYELMIFDRWGNLIWETDVWGRGWDGRANGGAEIAQMDVYVWKCKARELDTQREHRYIGHVTLVK